MEDVTEEWLVKEGLYILIMTAIKGIPVDMDPVTKTKSKYIITL
jgi:hypothetical protein